MKSLKKIYSNNFLMNLNIYIINDNAFNYIIIFTDKIVL